MRITITEICGQSRVFRSDGIKLREAIERLWSDAEVLEIHFESTVIASISFLDEAIAVLALEQPVEVLKSRLKLVALVDSDRRLLNAQIVSRARQRDAGNGGEGPGVATPPRQARSGRDASRPTLKKRAGRP